MEALINPTNLVSSFGYVAIFLLSIAQSCCVPTSSELTMGFAGALAATGHLNLVAAILVGASGEVIGAYLAWLIGRTAGRSIVDRYGKYVLLTHHDLDKAEAWYDHHPRWGVFGGRLVPVIRNFVALPAGVAEVPAVRFGLLTALGSLLWDGAMAGIGYGVGSRWHAIMHLFSDAGYVLAALAVIAVVALVVHRWRSYAAQTAADGEELINPRQEILSLVRRLAAPGWGVGERTAVAANERLTAAAGAVLFVLIFFEGVTLLDISGLIAMHIIVGLVLIPPLVVKLASTGWRFIQYYAGHPDFVRKGPPGAFLRALAPFLILTTVILFASGVALVVVHPPPRWLYELHRFDFVAWFFILAVHVLTYVWQVPGVMRRDLSRRRRYRQTSPRGRLLRLWVVAVSVAAGALLAAVMWPSASGHLRYFYHPKQAARAASSSR